MRRLSGLLLASTVLLAGCSTSDSSPDRDERSHRPLPVPTVSVSRQAVPAIAATDTVLPTVSGKFGRKPVITIPTAQPSGKFVITTVLAGHGPKARSNDIVIVDYAAKTWRSGKTLPDTYGNGGTPRVFPVGQDAVLPALDRAVEGRQAGSRVLVVAPPAAAYGDTGNARLGVQGTDTVVFAVDIVKIIPADSIVQGQQEDVPEALPQVRATRSAATIAVPDTAPPKSLISQTLVEGSGPRVKSGQTIVIRRAGAVWAANRGKDQAHLFDSSWSHGPSTVVIGCGNLIEGLDQALVRTDVGSRVLVVIPPGLAYGATAQKDIRSKSTVVFIVDVLAASGDAPVSTATEPGEGDGKSSPSSTPGRHLH